MRQALFVLVFGLSLAIAGAPQVRAKEVIPNAPSCMVPSNLSGKPAEPAHQQVGYSAFAAQATWGNGQRPTITYAPVYFRLEPAMQMFLSLHECGHLVLRTTDEFKANCYAIQHGTWTPGELEEIGRRHQALGLLGPQYGGSGSAFWAGTKRACPQSFVHAS